MICPLQPDCLGTRTGDPLQFPVKAEKPERPTRYGHAFVIRDRAGDIYLRQRPPKGLLAKMTEVPTSDWSDSKRDPDFPIEGQWTHRGQVVHVFTHFRLELEVWTATDSSDSSLSDGWWSSPNALGKEALPSLFTKVLKLALR